MRCIQQLLGSGSVMPIIATDTGPAILYPLFPEQRVNSFLPLKLFFFLNSVYKTSALMFVQLKQG